MTCSVVFYPPDEHSERTSVVSLLSEGVGRPRFDIPQCQLEFLLQLGFSVPRISCLLGVSVSTVHRRMTFYGFSVQSLYTSLNDEQLDAIVSEIQVRFPTAGNRQMCGLLRLSGIRIQFHRIREAQRRVDPEGSFMRRLYSLYRPMYSVAGPQHLWHIDGNRKLIRWGLTHSVPFFFMYIHYNICKAMFVTHPAYLYRTSVHEFTLFYVLLSVCFGQ